MIDWWMPFIAQIEANEWRRTWNPRTTFHLLSANARLKVVVGLALGQRLREIRFLLASLEIGWRADRICPTRMELEPLSHDLFELSVKLHAPERDADIMPPFLFADQHQPVFGLKVPNLGADDFAPSCACESGEGEHGVDEWMLGIVFHPGEQFLNLFLAEE